MDAPLLDIIRKILLATIIILVCSFGLFPKITSSQSELQPEEKVVDPLFEKIAECESHFDLKAKNPNSSASGEFQITKGTWESYGKRLWGDDWVLKDKFSTDNRELAWYIYTEYGTNDWEADKKSYDCWKGEIPNAIYVHKKISTATSL